MMCLLVQKLKSRSTRKGRVCRDAKYVLSSSRSLVNISRGQLGAAYTPITVILLHAAATKQGFFDQGP